MKKAIPVLLTLSAFLLAACEEVPASSTSSEPPASSSETPASSSEETHGWTSSDLETFASAIGEGHEIPYWVDGFSYTVELDEYYGDIIISVADFAVSDLVDIVLVDHEDAGFEEDSYSTETSLSLAKVYDDYTQVAMTAVVVDEDGEELTEGSGTAVVTYTPVAVTVTEWPGLELEAAISYYLDADIEVPTHSTGAEIGYQVTAGLDWSTFSMYVLLTIYGGDGYDADLEDAGWSLIEGLYSSSSGASLPYYFDPTGLVGAVVLNTELSDGTPASQVQFMNNSFFLEWPDVGALLGDIGITNAPAIPEPDLTGLDFIQLYVDSSSVNLFAYGVDVVDAYVAQLEAANWTAVFVDPATGYVTLTDTNEVLYATVGYDAQYDDTDFIFMANDGTYRSSWPSDGYTSIVELVDLCSTTSLPAPTFSYDYLAAEYDDFYEIGSIAIVDYDASGALVDHEEEYGAILAGANWTYDAELEGYISPAQDILATVLHSLEYGTVVYLEVYVPVYSEWPTEAIATKIANLGVNITLPAIVAAGELEITVTNSDDGTSVTATTITISGLTDAEAAAYPNTLVTAGYVATESTLFDSLYLSNGAVVSLSYYDGEMTILITKDDPYDPDLVLADMNSYLSFMYIFEIPELSFPTGSLAMWDLGYNETSDYTFLFSVVNCSSAAVSTMGDELDEAFADWTKAGTPSAGATATYSTTTEDDYGTYDVVVDIIEGDTYLDIYVDGVAHYL